MQKVKAAISKFSEVLYGINANIRYINMDAVIKAAVRDELQRQAAEQSRQTQQQVREQAVQPRTSSATTSTGKRSSGQNLSSRTVSRLSGLLDRVKKGAKTSGKGKKRKIDKEHRIQVRWLHYNGKTKLFDSVRQKNGGGNRFVAYNASTPLTLNDLKIKASNLFFPEGNSVFAGPVDNMVLSICDITKTAIFDFPDDGTLDGYLKEKGLYPSTTYFFLRSQPKDTIDSEFEVDSPEEIDTVNSAYGLKNTSDNDFSPANQYTVSSVCVDCSCAYLECGMCLSCQQNNDF